MQLTATSCYDFSKSCYAPGSIIKKTKAPPFGTSRFRIGFGLGRRSVRGRQQTKAVNRKNGGLKRKSRVAKVPIRNCARAPSLQRARVIVSPFRGPRQAS